ncbi:hypothetical protein Bca101_031737 [Brassica carinata]
MGHQTSLSVVLSCTSARCERICSLIGDVCPGEWTKIFDPMQTHGRHASMGMCLVCSCTLDPDDFFSFIKMRCCPHGWDWSELAASKMENSGTQDFSLHFLRLSSSMDRVDECMGPEPGILRGRILARLGIRGMRRFNKTRSPKLRILMLDSAGLACASWACKSCNGLSFRGDVRPQSMLGWPGIVLSWNPEDPGHALPKSEGTRRLNALSSQNPEAGWTFVQGPGGRIDYHPGTRRLDGLSSWNPEAGWTFVQEPKGWMNYRPRTRRLDGLSSWNPKADLMEKRLMFQWASTSACRCTSLRLHVNRTLIDLGRFRLLALHIDWTERLIGLAGEGHLCLLKSAVGDLFPRSEAGILDLGFALQ